MITVRKIFKGDKMKILEVVSDFPKVTETFAVLNLRHFMEAGHEISLFHIKPFRTQEVVHPEARPIIEKAFSFHWVGIEAMKALSYTMLKHPIPLLRVIARIIWAFRREPVRLAASLAILPKSLAMAKKVRLICWIPSLN